jgi:ribosomal protein S18 acetylase RimI-like enzyme
MNTAARNRDLLIRLAHDRDSESIATLLFEAFQEFQSLYTKEAFSATVISPAQVCSRIKEGPVWVAEYLGKLVGTVSVLPVKGDIYLRGMAVSPAAQGLKIGRALLQQAVYFAGENSFNRLFLKTTPFLDKAIKLYEGFGFVRMEEREEDFWGTPVFLMEKRLFPSQEDS